MAALTLMWSRVRKASRGSVKVEMKRVRMEQPDQYALTTRGKSLFWSPVVS